MGTLPDAVLRERARRLRDAVEPICGNVYFAPEAQEAYSEYGLSWWPAYFGSRGACLGRVAGEVVASAFGVFNPAIVVPAVDEAWAKAGPAALLAARERGAVASLARILGPEPAGAARATAVLRRGADAARFEGRTLFAGLRSLGWPGTLLGDLWRACDLVREHRGDSHIAAWTAAGLSPVEAQLLIELWWRMPSRVYTRTRGWSEQDMDTAYASLQDKGIIDSSLAFTEDGVSFREAVEWATDAGERSVLEAIGEDIEELLALLTPWAEAVVAAKGYPTDPRTVTRI
jgi:hypothetical protein